MLAPQALMKGLISRYLPNLTLDSSEAEGVIRLGRYREPYMVPIIRKQHGLADEGSYFCVGNIRTGIATGATQTAFADTTSAFLTVYNSARPGADAKLIYVDWLRLICTAGGTAGTQLLASVLVDQGPRAGLPTNLTPNIVSPNMDKTDVRSCAIIAAGAGTIPASSSFARVIAGQMTLKTAIPAAFDTYLMNFGDVETTAGVFGAYTVTPVAPVVIGPGQAMIVHIWLPAQSAASSYIPEMCWWER